MVFDVTSSFTTWDTFRDEFLKIRKPLERNNIPLILIGNKVDLLDKGTEKEVNTIITIMAL